MSTNKNGGATATASASGGIGLFGLTFVVLLVLKLTGLAQISWWWVFAPVIAGFSLSLVVLFIAVVIILFAAWQESK